MRPALPTRAAWWWATAPPRPICVIPWNATASLLVQDPAVQEATGWLLSGREQLADSPVWDDPHLAVLDMCAAPGGKSARLGAAWPGGAATAGLGQPSRAAGSAGGHPAAHRSFRGSGEPGRRSAAAPGRRLLLRRFAGWPLQRNRRSAPPPRGALEPGPPQPRPQWPNLAGPGPLGLRFAGSRRVAHVCYLLAGVGGERGSGGGLAGRGARPCSPCPTNRAAGAAPGCRGGTGATASSPPALQKGTAE